MFKPLLEKSSLRQKNLDTTLERVVRQLNWGRTKRILKKGANPSHEIYIDGKCTNLIREMEELIQNSTDNLQIKKAKQILGLLNRLRLKNQLKN